MPCLILRGNAASTFVFLQRNMNSTLFVCKEMQASEVAEFRLELEQFLKQPPLVLSDNIQAQCFLTQYL